MKKYLKFLPLALALIAGTASAQTSGFQDLVFNSNHVAKGAFTFENFDDLAFGSIHLAGADISKSYLGYEFTLAQDSNITFLGKYISNAPNDTWSVLDVYFSETLLYSHYIPAGASLSFSEKLSAGHHCMFLFPWMYASSGFGSFVISAQPVPEPETYALMGLGLVGLLAARKRKRTS